MRSLLTILLLVATAANAQVAALRWDVQQDRPVAQDWYIYQGETVDLIPRLVQGTTPVAISNTPVTFRYREPGLAAGLYRETPATNPAVGTLTLRWTTVLDAGASYYDYQFIVGSNALNPRVTGKLVMRATLGVPPSTSPPPAIAGCATPADLQSVSNALAAALQDEGTARIAGDDASRTNHVASLAAEAALRIAGDDASRTNHVASLAAESEARIAGDAASLPATWPSTGTVDRATYATILKSGDDDTWTTTIDGVTTRFVLTPYTNTILLASFSGAYDGTPPSVGMRWYYAGAGSYVQSFTNSANTPFAEVVYEGSSGWSIRDDGFAFNGDFNRLFDTRPPYEAECSFAYCVVTSTVVNASQPWVTEQLGSRPTYPAVTNIVSGAVSGHNLDPTSHADIRAAVAAIPLPPTNVISGWLVWDSGSNCFWRVSATNLRFYIWSTP